MCGMEPMDLVLCQLQGLESNNLMQTNGSDHNTTSTHHSTLAPKKQLTHPAAELTDSIMITATHHTELQTAASDSAVQRQVRRLGGFSVKVQPSTLHHASTRSWCIVAHIAYPRWGCVKPDCQITQISTLPTLEDLHYCLPQHVSVSQYRQCCWIASIGCQSVSMRDCFTDQCTRYGLNRINGSATGSVALQLQVVA